MDIGEGQSSDVNKTISQYYPEQVFLSRDPEKIAPQLRLMSEHIKENGFVEYSIVRKLLLSD